MTTILLEKENTSEKTVMIMVSLPILILSLLYNIYFISKYIIQLEKENISEKTVMIMISLPILILSLLDDTKYIFRTIRNQRAKGGS